MQEAEALGQADHVELLDLEDVRALVLAVGAYERHERLFALLVQLTFLTFITHVELFCKQLLDRYRYFLQLPLLNCQRVNELDDRRSRGEGRQRRGHHRVDVVDEHFERHLLIDEYELDVAVLVWQEEEKRAAGTTRPSRAAASVHERGGQLGRVILHHPVDVVHVDATRHYVGADQNAAMYTQQHLNSLTSTKRELNIKYKITCSSA